MQECKMMMKNVSKSQIGDAKRYLKKNIK